jgi:hypothetical protein
MKHYLVLFIYGLFYGTVSNLHYVASNDWMIVNNEFKSIWKEAVMAQLNVLSWYLISKLKKTTNIISQDSWCPSQYLNTSQIQVRGVPVKQICSALCGLNTLKER